MVVFSKAAILEFNLNIVKQGQEALRKQILFQQQPLELV